MAATDQQRPHRLIGIAAASGAFLLFAGQFVVSKHGIIRGLSPDDITLFRYAVAGAIATPFIARWGLADLAGLGLKQGIILTLLSAAPYFFVMTSGLALAPAGHAVILNPGMTLVGGIAISAIWLNERLTKAGLAAAFFGLAGLSAIGWDSFVTPTGNTWIGDALFLITGLAWAIYMTLLVRWQVDPVKAAFVVAFLSLAYIPFHFASTTDRGIHDIVDIAIQALYQGVFHGLIAMALFAFAVRRLGAGTVALMTPIVPAAGLILASQLLSEELSASQWLGAGLICAAMLLAARRGAQ